jgi:hypothetical protein
VAISITVSDGKPDAQGVPCLGVFGVIFSHKYERKSQHFFKEKVHIAMFYVFLD